MFSHKKSIKNQQYEKYWSLTLEYSDFCDKNFNHCLSIILDFMDKNPKIDSKLYQKLQNEINKFNPKKDLASVRKSINQFFKLGFINNQFNGYHKKAREFLAENKKSKKKILYSEILYDNASFSRSFTKSSNDKELNFLIKTLEHCGEINKNNLLAIMMIDISEIKKGFLTSEELMQYTEQINANKFYERKYNQVNYLWNLCGNVLTGIYLSSDKQYLTLDRPELGTSETYKGRDAYKQTLYKYSLYEESREIFSNIFCYVEFLKYPVLIASHIKPYVKCDDNEKFDKDNGLLLSRSIDQLFDQGWISFDDTGKIILSNNLDENLKKYLKEKKLDKKIINDKRKVYLKYHRENVYNPTKEYKF